MSDFDVIIVGGGIAGASLGAEIAGKRRALIVEAEEQCGYHSTGRSAAFFLESYGGPEVAKLTTGSAAFLNEPPADFADHGFLHWRGALHLSEGDWPELPVGLRGRRVERDELERMLPGIRDQWLRGLFEPACADIDVAALHAAFLRQFRRMGGTIATRSRLVGARRVGEGWEITLADGSRKAAPVLVNAAGAWADDVAQASGISRLGLEPKRRTMVQLRVGRAGLKDLPLVNDSAGSFYFKGEGDRTIWLSPHDEIATGPCDAAPEEIDVATAIDRFENVVDWPVEQVERRWAGLRTFAPDRLPVYGFDPAAPGFFWCAGQGGFGIQTSPAAAKMAAALLLDEEPGATDVDIDPAAFSPTRFACQ
jgi:D-arginine dehydrogenase